jgi:hypothetical protein
MTDEAMSAEPLNSISRGFLPWRFSDAGPVLCRALVMGRHPKTFTADETNGTQGVRVIVPITTTKESIGSQPLILGEAAL